MSDNKCICEGNWRLIVSEYEPLIGRQYMSTDKSTEGILFRFFGIVHSNDDYYYGMYSRETGDLRLLSCVMDIETFGFKLMPA